MNYNVFVLILKLTYIRFRKRHVLLFQHEIIIPKFVCICLQNSNHPLLSGSCCVIYVTLLSAFKTTSNLFLKYVYLFKNKE